MRARSINGLSLVELLVAVGLVSGVGLLVMMSSRQQAQNEASDRIYRDRDESIFLAQERILGRLRAAASCTKTGGALQCLQDIDVPPTGVLTPVRFVFSAPENALNYQTRPGGAGPWRTQERYPGIAAFTVCDDAEMLGNRCPILPAGLNRRPTWTGVDGRFFRFQIQGLGTAISATVVRGAFYVRNPAPFGPNTSYALKVP